MARDIAEIELEVRALDVLDKERLLRALLEDLDGPPDPDAEAALAQEIARRCKELDDGTVQSIPAEEVFEELRAQLS